MSLRNRQREYFYKQLDRLFPGLRQKYARTFGYNYQCSCPNARQLAQVFNEQRAKYGISTRVKPYRREKAIQLALF